MNNMNMNKIINNKNNKINKKTLIELIQVRKQMSIPHPMKQYYNNIIPLNIFQTWHSKTLPPLMYAATVKLKNANPRFNYQLYDDNDCREFIKNNFEGKVLYAYDKLIPGAFKADLWRYCILFKYGGVYLDIKYVPMKGFKLINLLEKEHFCLDADNNGIYNAIMVCVPGNIILSNAINQIVENVKHNYYGGSCLDVTGPGLLSRYFSREQKDSLDLKHKYYISLDYRYILYNNYYIFKSYPGYISEHSHFQKVEHYTGLWGKRQIYN